MFIPWILHGTYDFILMVGEASGSDVGILGVIGIIFIIIGGMSYARYEAMALSLVGNGDGSKAQNIHDAIVHVDEASGQVLMNYTNVAFLSAPVRLTKLCLC